MSLCIFLKCISFFSSLKYKSQYVRERVQIMCEKIKANKLLNFYI